MSDIFEGSAEHHKQTRFGILCQLILGQVTIHDFWNKEAWPRLIIPATGNALEPLCYWKFHPVW